MSSRGWTFRLQDMLDSISKIKRYVEGLTFEQFTNDEKTTDAVIRQITVIGEAASHLPEDIIIRAPEIPWRSIRGIRNVVVHEYFGINAQILWQTVTLNLPKLKSQLETLQEELSP